MMIDDLCIAIRSVCMCVLFALLRISFDSSFASSTPLSHPMLKMSDLISFLMDYDRTWSMIKYSLMGIISLSSLLIERETCVGFRTKFWHWTRWLSFGLDEILMRGFVFVGAPVSSASSVLKLSAPIPFATKHNDSDEDKEDYRVRFLWWWRWRWCLRFVLTLWIVFVVVDGQSLFVRVALANFAAAMNRKKHST